MSKFAVKIEPETFKSNINVTGKIRIEFGGNSFPDNIWYDFPVIILGWWLQGFQELLRPDTTTVKCYFMDGPYFFEVSKQSSTHWCVQFLKDELAGFRTFGNGSVEIDEVIGVVVSASRIVIEKCIANGWRSTDLEILRDECLKIRQ